MRLTHHNATKQLVAAATVRRLVIPSPSCSTGHVKSTTQRNAVALPLSFTAATSAAAITSFALTFSGRTHWTGASAATPPLAGKQVDKTDQEQQPAQDVCVLGTLDIFAKSRMLNYLSRHTSAADDEVGGDSSRKGSPFAVTKTPDKMLYRAELLVPVEALVSGVMQHTKLWAVGYAEKERDAIVAACMHGERCLDAVGIPLFASDRLQRKRVEEARREGRYAPMPGDPVREVRIDDLPYPVLHKQDDNSSSSKSSSGASATKSSKSRVAAASYPVLRSYQPDYHTVKRRYNDFSRRCGGDPFLRGMAGELAYLQARIFQHNTDLPGMDDCDDENTEFTIDPIEVELLQPSRTTPEVAAATTTTEPHPHCSAMRLALINSRPLNEHRIAGFVDESEGGRFDLVEGEQDTWWMHEELPGLVCLFDPFAAQRLDELYASSFNASFDACVETQVAEELTQVDVGFGPQCQKQIKWYTASAPLPSYPSLRAVGKAMDVAHAVALCAMHAELLLCFLGVPLSASTEEQTSHYDACLRYGRLVSPLTRELDDGVRALLPKPLKQWHRIKKTRKRGAPMNVAEKLVALNRRVVADLRQHLVEVDICSQPQYRELLEVSVSALRQFMVERRHPYESAYVNYIYSKNNQFRCSIYLPLPEVYGVRGGSAIGATPESARKLCALHAVDTLCALNVPLTHNEEKLQQLMELRKRFGLILPRDPTDHSVSSSMLCNIRSPPGYREVPGCATTRIPPHQDVWNLMMADAGDFDVVKDVEAEKCYKLGLPDIGTVLRELFQTYLLTVGWTATEHWSRMKHYQGMQHWNGRLRVPCNNYWMELPVDEKIYGRRIALGRCIFRKTAERAFLIHTFRILHALRLAPWDNYSDAVLLQFLRCAPNKRIERERKWWEFVMRELITPAADEAPPTMGPSAVRDAEVVIPLDADLKAILSPNPVMTHELAKRTFV
ncbi:hypothetical protein DQ04_05531060 [Trypanosoma grayi]|uniref:hypothetical protein n=1 Tax=Trypanosoma grayi TaxID=71804 RepID=UPI0004F3EFA8|nr:hypothetical protein DQ04_05531060 [Trypanosoma grayi]KEG09257.1 hypothetical protein DQ04_05531060 [Trypanosoma grayi]